MSAITSKPYRPAMACEGCCFGGWHAEWCEHGWFDCGVAEKSDLVRVLEEWRKDFPSVIVSELVPPVTIALVSTRGRIVEYDAQGNELWSRDETEEEWAKRCGAIRNVGAPIGILPHIVGDPCDCHECRRRSARTVNSYDHINGDWLGRP